MLWRTKTEKMQIKIGEMEKDIALLEKMINLLYLQVYNQQPKDKTRKVLKPNRKKVDHVVEDFVTNDSYEIYDPEEE